MWKFKSCPKCEGDLYVVGHKRRVVQCLQCGYLADLASVLKARKEEVVNKEARLVRTGHAKPVAK